MKILTYLTAALALTCLAPISHADDSAKAKATKEKPAKANPKFKSAFKKIKFISDEVPSQTAKYYFYLTSGPHCGNCKQTIGSAVKAYEEMKETGEVEMILVAYNCEAEQGLAFRDDNGGTFPVMMYKDASKLPNFKAVNVLPHACIVNAKGEVMVELAARTIIQNWRKYTLDKKKK